LGVPVGPESQISHVGVSQGEPAPSRNLNYPVIGPKSAAKLFLKF